MAPYFLLSSFLTICVLPAVGGDDTNTNPATTVNWPQFRGAFAQGVADGALPMEWDVASGKNIKWKTPIPGLGFSSPIIWGNRVFVTTCISGKDDPELRVGLYGNIAPVEDDTVHQWRVYCLDKDTGKVMWEQTAHQGVPAVKRHTKSTHANSTPATDGTHVVAFFGSEGLYCYSMAGKQLWKKDFGVLDAGYYKVPEAQWEYGSSPIIHQGKVIVQCDVQGESFVAALDVKTGKEIWRKKRDEVPTWSTPTVHENNGRKQVIFNGYRHIGGYDLETGKELWRMEGGGDIPVPTPIVAHDLIYITNAHGGGAPLYAIHPTAVGTITLEDNTLTNQHIAWSYARRGTYMQTPIVYGDYLYACRDNGVMTSYDAKTGAVLHRVRLGNGSTGFTASPVAGDDKLFFSSEEGDIYVIRAGPKPRPIAINKMNEVCMATPAISDGALFIRTQRHLFCVQH